MEAPNGITISPSGSVVVADTGGGIYELDATDGTILRTFTTAAVDVAFGPNGDLFVSSGDVLRYDWVTGNFLNVFGPGGGHGLTLNITDTTLPTTTASPPGGTYSSAQSVTLTCDDDSGSGCQTTYYCLGSSCIPTAVYSGPINIQSSTDLRFYSTDKTNNSESVKTETYTINLCISYKFEPIAEIGEGYFPSINDLGEIVYEKYDSNGNPGVFSTTRGWLTFSSQFPDINNQGEVVFSHSFQGWYVWSTERGQVGMGSLPSINNNGEIVYENSQNLPRLLISTTRGVLISDDDVNAYSFYPEVNDNEEVVYLSKDSSGNRQIFSTERGQITFLPADRGVGTPSINNNGEIIYIAADDSGTKQIFSTVHGQITHANSFPEPFHAGPWTGSEEFGLYFTGVGYYPDINNKGQIVFSQMLAEGPYFDGQEWYAIGSSRLWLATPIANITVSPTSHDFGSVTIGSSSSPQTFTISNTGTADLHISGITLSDTINYSLNINGGTNPCGSTTPTITPNSSCTVTVIFSPSSVGTKNANLTINTDDPDTSVLNVPLSGTGQMQQCFSNFDCGFELYCKKPEGSCYSTGFCSVRPGICQTLFMPVCGCNGVTYPNDCEAAQSGVSVAYQGECVVPPDISVSPTSIDFGDVVVGSSSASQTVTISNTGGTNLTIGEIKIIGTDAFTIPADGCSNQTVSSCTLLVRFSPTALGARNAILRIPSNDPDENPLDVPLSGNGVVLSTEITLLVPNGGEVLPSGGIYGICWKAPSNAVKFDLQYTTGGSTWIPIKTVTGLSCTHWEEVPVVTVNKKTCRVKVIGYNSNSVKVGEDISDKPFTIEVLRVVSPNGGETLQSGSTWGIRWLTNKTIRPVAKTVLKYTTDGTTWKAIKTLSGNPGNYLWKVPFVSSTKCKVKVILKDADGANVGTDVSDKFFTIQP